MAILNILKDEDETLRKTCRPVTEITPRIIRLLDDMKETLIEADGAGLAAPQVGVLRRIAICDTQNGMVELINPEIVSADGKQEELEGCLSVPGVWGITDRPKSVTVKALDRNGKEFTVSGEDLDARCFCHEIDHLDGVLFTDKAVHILTPEEVDDMMGDKRKKKTKKKDR